MPSPMTLSTIKNLFVNLFDLDQSMLSDPKWHLFILNSSMWKSLTDVTLVDKHSTVLLVDSADISSTSLSHVPGSSAPFTSCSATASPEDILLSTSSATGKVQNSGRNGLWQDHPRRPVSIDSSFASSGTGASGWSSSTPVMDAEQGTRGESL